MWALVPPLVVPKSEINQALQILDGVLEGISAREARFSRLAICNAPDESASFLSARGRAQGAARGARRETVTLRGRTLALDLSRSASTRNARLVRGRDVRVSAARPSRSTPAAARSGRGEPARDTGRVLLALRARDVVRTFAHATGRRARRATRRYFRDQRLATDRTTRAGAGGSRDRRGSVAEAWTGFRYARLGDGKRRELVIEAAGALGLDLRVVLGGYDPSVEVLAAAQATGRGRIAVVRDPREGPAAPMSSSPTCGRAWGRRRNREARARAFSGLHDRPVHA